MQERGTLESWARDFTWLECERDVEWMRDLFSSAPQWALERGRPVDGIRLSGCLLRHREQRHLLAGMDRPAACSLESKCQPGNYL